MGYFLSRFRHPVSQRTLVCSLLILALILLSACGGSSSKKGSGGGAKPPDGAFSLVAPTVQGALLSGITYELPIRVTFSNAANQDRVGLLSFQFLAGPQGATLDPNHGTLLWTPTASQEGNRFSFNIRAHDGTLSADVAFEVNVAAPIPLTTSVQGQIVTVQQSGSLQGFQVQVPATANRPASNLTISQVLDSDTPNVPAAITRVSDFFRIAPVSSATAPLQVRIPRNLMPVGVRPELLRVFTYETGEITPMDAEPGASVTAALWATSGFNIDLTDDYISFDTQALGALSFLGYYPMSDDELMNLWGTSSSARQFAAPNCQTKHPEDANLFAVSVCKSSDNTESEIQVIQRPVWREGLGVADIHRWLQEARVVLQRLDLSVNPRIEVHIQPLENALGMWRSTTPNVLYVSSAITARPDIEVDAASMAKVTTVHELFHHVQNRNRIAGQTNVMTLPAIQRNWLTEGTAVWFEDEVYDELNRYRRWTATQPIPAHLARGLGELGDSGSNAYRYFPWWKLLHIQCSGFNLLQAFNVPATNTSTVANLASLINSDSWNCRFGVDRTVSNALLKPNFFTAGGSQHRFASALLYYAYATDAETAKKHNRHSLLESDEANIPFAAPQTVSLTPSAACQDSSTAGVLACPDSASNAIIMPAASVIRNQIAATPNNQQQVRIMMRNHHANSDLYVFIAQVSGTNTGWPDGWAYRIAPGANLDLLGDTLDRNYRGNWIIYAVNTAHNTLLYTLAAGIKDKTSQPDVDLSKVTSARVRLDNLVATMSQPNGTLVEESINVTESNSCGGTWVNGSVVNHRFMEDIERTVNNCTDNTAIHLDFDATSLAITRMTVMRNAVVRFAPDWSLKLVNRPNTQMNPYLEGFRWNPTRLSYRLSGDAVCNFLDPNQVAYQWSYSGDRVLQSYRCSAATQLEIVLSMDN